MSDDLEDGSNFTLTPTAALAAFMGLSVAFDVLLEAAVFPERVKINEHGAAARLEALASYVLRETKNMPLLGLSETDEADGIAAAIFVIEETKARLSCEI